MQLLARRPFFGALVDDDGAVEQVWPGSPADAVGLRVGDRVISIDGVPVRTPEQVLERLSRHRPGDLATLVLSHDGELRIGPLMIVPRPRETVDGADVIHGQIEVDGLRQRTILVRPTGVVRPPVVVLLGDVSLHSVELAPSDRSPLLGLVAGLARAGIASLRIEKRGIGDSEGGPAADVDFEAERRAAIAALDEIASGRLLDTAAIVLFGHSMGGMLAPLVADRRVRGVAAYGTWATRFTDGMIASLERQRPSALHENRRDAALLRAVVEGELSIADAVAAQPELADAPSLGDGERLFGRTVAYFRQLQRHDLAAAWTNAGVPALLLHGDRDLVTCPADHAAIAERLVAAGIVARASELSGYAHDMGGPGHQLLHELIAFVHSIGLGD